MNRPGRHLEHSTASPAKHAQGSREHREASPSTQGKPMPGIMSRLLPIDTSIHARLVKLVRIDAHIGLVVMVSFSSPQFVRDHHPKRGSSVSLVGECAVLYLLG